MNLKKVPLSIGKSKFFCYLPVFWALVDSDDYDRIMEFRWTFSQKTLRYGVIYRRTDKRKLQKLHRFILGLTDPKIEVDHINGNFLDNRKENLRICTRRENIDNRRFDREVIKPYKRLAGVQLSPDGRYYALIRCGSFSQRSGPFNSDIEARNFSIYAEKSYLKRKAISAI